MKRALRVGPVLFNQLGRLVDGHGVQPVDQIDQREVDADGGRVASGRYGRGKRVWRVVAQARPR